MRKPSAQATKSLAVPSSGQLLRTEQTLHRLYREYARSELLETRSPETALHSRRSQAAYTRLWDALKAATADSIVVADYREYAEVAAFGRQSWEFDEVVLAWAHESLGMNLASHGKHAAAVDALNNAASVWELLKKPRGGALDPRQSLYERIGDELAAEHRGDEAIDAFRRATLIAIKTARRTQHHDPKETTAFLKLGDACAAVGRHREALLAYVAGVNYFKNDPRGLIVRSFARDCAVFLDRIGTVLSSMEAQWLAAATAHRTAITVRENASVHNRRREWHIEHAISHDNIGTLYFRNGRIDEALTYFVRALALRQRVEPMPNADIRDSYLHLSRTFESLELPGAAKVFEKLSNMQLNGTGHPAPALDNDKANPSILFSNDAAIAFLDRLELYLRGNKIIGAPILSEPYHVESTDDRNAVKLLEQLLSEHDIPADARDDAKRGILGILNGAKEELQRSKLKPPVRSLPAEQVAALIAHGRKHPYAKRPKGDKRDIFEWIRDTYSRWYPGILTNHLHGADPNLATRLHQRLSRARRGKAAVPEWFDVPTQKENDLRAAPPEHRLKIELRREIFTEAKRRVRGAKKQSRSATPK